MRVAEVECVGMLWYYSGYWTGTAIAPPDAYDGRGGPSLLPKSLPKSYESVDEPRISEEVGSPSGDLE